MIYKLHNIEHNKLGFDILSDLYAQAKDRFFETIEIDMSSVTWIDADMCSAFGAILYKLSDNINTIKLSKIVPKIDDILKRNGFLSHYGGQQTPDFQKTTISYKRFDVKDDRYFAEYIDKELMRNPGMPTMSQGLQKEFQASIFEIFSNAVLHSSTKLGIFSCGQLYPNRNQLLFSVADLGVGIWQNVKSYTKADLSAVDAINWATTAPNTTKGGKVPGGLGLKLLSEFIDKNGGSIQIVSDLGYWKREKRKITTEFLKKPFPGTVVNVEINTADSNSYMLSSEIPSANIF